MEDPAANAILNQYFRRLDQALAGLHDDRRAQILEDVRAHVEECLSVEPDRSDATVMAILDRVGDPDEIARVALADDGSEGVDRERELAPAGSWLSGTRIWLAGLTCAVLAVAIVLVVTLSGGRSSAAPGVKANAARGLAANVASVMSGVNKNGWLPAADVSGGGGIDNSQCGPQTLSGSEPAASLKAAATEVASGTADGHNWSVWSRKGQSGANGLENGGVIVDGVAYGMCPGFPNPAEMEMLEPAGGGNGIAYGVVGYAGAAKVAIYSSTAGTFDADKLVGQTDAQKVNGVGFFITRLSESGCDATALELNTASANYAAEHNFGFSTDHCSAGKLVPISDSQGMWQLPATDFPNKFQSPGGAGGGTATPTLTKGGWLPAADVSGGGGIDNSQCGPQTLSGSEPAASLKAAATEVASGTVDGHNWSLWSKKGERGADGLENGGIIVDGDAHGLCPGFPNPAEMEMLEPAGGGNGIAYGVVGYPGTAKVNVYQGTTGTFDAGKLLASTTAQTVNGVGFFVTGLAQSACDVRAVELNTASSDYGAEHNLGFNTDRCTSGQLVPISWSQGMWQLPKSDFPDRFQANGERVGGGLTVRAGGDFSMCGSLADAAGSGQAESAIPGARQVASGTLDSHSWSLWSKSGEKGAAALEDAGVIVDGHAYGLCPGFPNPAELELIDPSGTANGIVAGVSGYSGRATVGVYVGSPNTFRHGALLYRGDTVAAEGTGFFIGELPKPACDYKSLELAVSAQSGHAEHSLEFSGCTAGHLVQITGSMGEWSASG